MNYYNMYIVFIIRSWYYFMYLLDRQMMQKKIAHLL